MAKKKPLTEKDWLNPKKLFDVLDHMRRKSANASERKLRLYAAACCRRFWHVLEDERCREAVEIAERFADGQATNEERQQAFRRACRARDEHPEPVRRNIADEKTCAYYGASYVVAAQTHVAAWNVPHYVKRHFDWKEPDKLKAEELVLHRLFLDIFGNSFRPANFDSSWQTANVTAVAQTIYDERRFEDLPILADALEESGCSNDDILGHCRGPGEHVRGCWVVDLILGKE